MDSCAHGFLREAETGLPVSELCRRHGFSEVSYYHWRNNFGSMSFSDAKRLNLSRPCYFGSVGRLAVLRHIDPFADGPPSGNPL